MKERKSRKRKVADFPPEFLTAWNLASEGKLEIAFATKGKALNFRQQLHACRKAWIEENGQAAISHWFNYDLVVEPQFDPRESEKIQHYLLRCTQLDWKKQLRVLAPSSPQELVGKPLFVTVADETVVEMKPVPTAEANEALAKSLEKLGFKS